MIFIHVYDKKCKAAIFGQRRWHKTTTAFSIPKANKLSILYQASCFLKIKKKPFGLRTWKGQLMPRVLLELPLLSRTRRKKSERGRLSSPTGAEREPYNYVVSLEKAAIRHNTILHWVEKPADSKYSEFSLGWESVISQEC